MAELLMPPAIEVAVPVASPDATERSINALTQLFRPECYPLEALQLVYDRNAGMTEVSATLFGCSNGAERDTYGTLHNLSGFAGRLCTTGYDNNLPAITMAKAGYYWLPRQLFPPSKLAETGATLKRCGFDVDLDTIHRFQPGHDPFGSMWAAQGYCLVDANPVRQGSQVTYKHQDVREGVPVTKKQELVTVTNVLPYHPPAAADAIVRHGVNVLADNGVLNVGTWAKDPRNKPMGTIAVGGKIRPGMVTYYDWLMSKTEQLQAEAGLEPVVWHAGLPVIFARG